MYWYCYFDCAAQAPYWKHQDQYNYFKIILKKQKLQTVVPFSYITSVGHERDWLLLIKILF